MAKKSFSLRRVAKKAGRSLKKRYFKGRGFSRPKLGRMARDLAMVKSMVNAEKEIYDQSITAQNVDLSTPYFQPITNITEGTGHGQRDGESVKLHGFRWNLRFSQQNSVTNPLYMKVWLVKYIGPRGTTPAISTFLKTDFDGNYSTMSDRNEDWYSSYRVITYSGLVKIPSDSVSGQTQFTLRQKYGRFKGKTHQRYSGAGATTLLTDQMYMIACTSGGDTATSTGGKFDSKLSISFYDN